MSYTFGHAMCAVPALEAGEIAFRGLGFTTYTGGRHTIGTQNSVVPLQRGYLELVSIYDEAAARRSPRRRAIADYTAAEGGGLFGFALRTTTIGDDVERLNDAGLCYGGPLHAERTTTDGTVLRWSVLRPTPQPCPAVLPILVEGDVSTPRFAPHANKISAATGIAIVGDDPSELVKSFEILLAQEPLGEALREDLAARATTFDASGFAIEILEPVGPGPAQRALERFGPGPVELHLLADDLSAVAGRVGLEITGEALVIPPILGCGLRLRITEGTLTSER